MYIFLTQKKDWAIKIVCYNQELVITEFDINGIYCSVFKPRQSLAFCKNCTDTCLNVVVFYDPIVSLYQIMMI